jgi:hypothetical protein
MAWRAVLMECCWPADSSVYRNRRFWPPPDGRAVKPTTPSSIDAAKTDTGLQQPSSRAQTTPQRAGPAAASAPELTQRLQTITHELSNLSQGIEQLKSSQAQLARDNAELAGHLKETQEELVRHDAELAKDLRAAREEMTRDNLSFAAQLKASQEQISGISEQLKATQEELNRLAVPKQLHPAISIAISTPAECDRDAQAGAEAAVTASWPVAEELDPIAARATLIVIEGRTQRIRRSGPPTCAIDCRM